MLKDSHYDVIIIGGSYAGLSAALALGRSLRNVLIIDGGSPCNEQTPHSHNFLTQDGEKPSDIAALAKSQVLNYETVQFINDKALNGKKIENGFEISTLNNQIFTSKKVIFATGIQNTMPNIKGFAECWGISVIHCPYCHGYEMRNQKTGIFANGEFAFHLASMVNNLTKDLTIFTSGKADFKPEQIEKLKSHNIQIIETEISEIEHKKGSLNKIILANGERLNLKALYAALPFTQHSDIPEKIGCELTELGYLKTTDHQATTVPGIYVCGDNSSMMRSVANAVYTGNVAGVLVNKELIDLAF